VLPNQIEVIEVVGFGEGEKAGDLAPVVWWSSQDFWRTVSLTNTVLQRTAFVVQGDHCGRSSGVDGRARRRGPP